MKDPISKDNLKSMLESVKEAVDDSINTLKSEEPIPSIRDHDWYDVYCCCCNRFMASYSELISMPLDINKCSRCSETEEERKKREAHAIFKEMEAKRNELERIESNIHQMEVLKKKILSENPTLTLTNTNKG